MLTPFAFGQHIRQRLKSAASWEQGGYSWDDKPTRVFSAGFNDADWKDPTALSNEQIQKNYLAGLDAALAKQQPVRYIPAADDPATYEELDANTSLEARQAFVRKLLQQMQTERPFMGAVGVPTKQAAGGLTGPTKIVLSKRTDLAGVPPTPPAPAVPGFSAPKVPAAPSAPPAATGQAKIAADLK